MEVKTPEVLELICKSQNSIKNIRSTISQKKEIKELTDKIKKILDVMYKNIKDELENLYGYEKRLEIIKDEELNENVGIIKLIIKNNLTKEVEC
ncbi:hypothetical protein [Paraclostridium bifermentans]|uniref:hypothetical protein n=1 Tax=Paraclostridium bifermentans TaxID=1490 RepID=UPI0034DF6D0C